MKFAPETAAALIRGVRAGASFDEACSSAGVNVHTGRTWLRNGRRDPKGPYGALAILVDGHRQARLKPERAAGSDQPLTLEEAERLLAAAARKGSVVALRLWFDRNAQRTAPAAKDDPLAALDELAARRARQVRAG